MPQTDSRLADRPILVLLHDAGGAEIVAAMIRAEGRSFRWNVVAPPGSPADTLFRRQGLADCLVPYRAGAPIDVPDRCGIVLYSPGWGAFPRDHVATFRRRGYTTVALLDHWIDYRERLGLEEGGAPSFTVACDEVAFRLASEQALPGVLKLKAYHVLERIEQYEQVAGAREAGAGSETLLLLSQTVDGGSAGQAEGFSYVGALEGRMLSALSAHLDGIRANWRVKHLQIRLHPAETRFRHEKVVREMQGVTYEVERAQDRDLLQSVADARVVVGMNSMALFTAFLCGKPVLSCIPDPAVPCTLPLPASVQVRDLAQVAKRPVEAWKAGTDSVDFFPAYDLRRLFEQMEEDSCASSRR